MMKDNVIQIDWSDEVLAGTVLTHAGENKAAISDKAAKVAAPAAPAAKAAPAKAVTPTTA